MVAKPRPAALEAQAGAPILIIHQQNSIVIVMGKWLLLLSVLILSPYQGGGSNTSAALHPTQDIALLAVAAIAHQPYDKDVDSDDGDDIVHVVSLAYSMFEQAYAGFRRISNVVSIDHRSIRAPPQVV